MNAILTAELVWIAAMYGPLLLAVFANLSLIHRPLAPLTLGARAG